MPTETAVLSPSPSITPTNTPTPSYTPTARPTPIPSPSPTPSATPTVATAVLAPESYSEPDVPLGYVTFDDFNASGPLDNNRWRPDMNIALCTSEQKLGFLDLGCESTVNAIIGAYWPIPDEFRHARGVAIAAQVKNEDRLASLDLAVFFTAPADEGQDSRIRAYYMELHGDTLAIRELYPREEGWPAIVLASTITIPDQPIVLQIEHDAGTLQFFINGQQILEQLENLPDLPPGASWDYWIIQENVSTAGDEETRRLDAQVYWAAVKLLDS